MPALISSFQEKHPGVHVILSEGSSAEISNSLIVHKNELGLIARLTYPPQLKVLSFSREELVLILRRNHPLTRLRKISLSDLAREPLIIREKGSGTRDVVLEKYREARIKPSILTEASNVDFIKELVETGNGISFVVKSAVQEELRRGTLKTRALVEGPFYLKSRYCLSDQPESLAVSPGLFGPAPGPRGSPSGKKGRPSFQDDD